VFASVFGSVEAGIIYSIMALGVYLSFRILNFPDMTVDGSFVTGAAVASVLITGGTNPILATFTAIFVGFIAGMVTGLLHTKGKINPLLSGILMMIALYSINLRILGRPNVSLLSEDTVFTQLGTWWSGLGIDDWIASVFTSIGLEGYIPHTWSIVLPMILFVLVAKAILDAFLKTEIGLAIRGTGDNEQMVRSFSVHTDLTKMLGLGIANALVALSGAFVAQYIGSADVGMGIGMIVIGLASVIIGEAVFGSKSIVRATFAVIGGAILYRLVVAFALKVEFLEAGDMKLITAIIVIIALLIPKWVDSMKKHRKKRSRMKNLNTEKVKLSINGTGGEQIAATKSDI
jgi:putative ABC transport system permease protein